MPAPGASASGRDTFAAATLALGAPLSGLRGIGPQTAERLASEGFRTVEDLLFHLPSRYEDRRTVSAVRDIAGAGVYSVRGRLRDLRLVRTRRRRFVILRARLDDGTASIPVVWFNQPYLHDRLKTDRDYLCHGTVRTTEGLLPEMVNPSCSPAGDELDSPRVVPVYSRLGPLGPAAVARLLAPLVGALDPAAVEEPLPEELRLRYRLPPLGVALRALHQPEANADVGALARAESPAHLRLVYGELLEMQIELALLRAREVRDEKPHRYRIDDRARSVAREVLPFRLTEAQKRVVREIVADLDSRHPMLRLLQGDVGSGKTIVAALCLLLAAESGLQSAFMAPTELLAEQQFASLVRLLGGHYRIALFSASSKSGAADRRALASGETKIAVGTHALIQEGVRFRRLGLAVVDEQHRFGVEQRRLLQAKGERPDILVMTATPIPRSLALTVYGDLESSILDELPPGRRPVATEVVPASARRDVYARLRAELELGARAYVVFPLIEESAEIAAASLAEMGAKVGRYLGEARSAVVHGRMAAADRERVMAAFARGDVQVLFATTVVEVGVDVPEATWMVIEGAERFGLAQLHQLRGRVGRSDRPSRCVAIHGRLSEDARRRLEVFASTTDGFRIAEADLDLRGPGDLLGTRQSGLPRLRLADLVAHREWLDRARSDAREVVSRLGEPAFAALRRRIEPRAASRYARFAGG